ncbi:MAG: DUF1080 domain-containing protein [Acidobacteria bacterium]|nr:DUF1080 domain-containing protein [Acidobacteriota bacterium]
MGKRKLRLLLGVAAASLCVAAPARQHGLVYAKDGSGIFGYKDTPVQPWSGYHVHDPDRPAPKKVDPGPPEARPGKPPSDAVVLFDGSGLSLWQPSNWIVRDGYVETVDGSLTTKQEFGSYQLHLEWRTPTEPEENIMNRGNNGVMLMGAFEIQIFESHDTKIYPDGQAAAIYSQTPPLVNACRKPGEWQSYDILFFAPVWENGKLTRRARVTVFHNGVLVHHNQEIHGTTPHRRLPGDYPAGRCTGPLVLAGHHSPVRFRNIWLRPLQFQNVYFSAN